MAAPPPDRRLRPFVGWVAAGAAAGGAFLGSLTGALSLPPSSALFPFGPGEQIVLATTFDDLDGWELKGGMRPSADGLSGADGAAWPSARYDLQPLRIFPLRERGVAIYLRARTDRSHPELGKLYLELTLGATPPAETIRRWEAPSLKLMIRPVAPSGLHSHLTSSLYLDSGWEEPPTVEVTLPNPNLFPTARAPESFRLALVPGEDQTLEVVARYLGDSGWQPLTSETEGSGYPHLLLAPGALPGGRPDFRSLAVIARSDRTHFEALAVTRLPPGATP